MFVLESDQRINLDFLVKLDQAVMGKHGCRIAMCVVSGSLSIEATDVEKIANTIQLFRFERCDSSTLRIFVGEMIFLNPKSIVYIENLQPHRDGFYRIHLSNGESLARLHLRE